MTQSLENDESVDRKQQENAKIAQLRKDTTAEIKRQSALMAS